MNQRLLVACLGIAVALGMVAMGQTARKTRKEQPPAQKSESESAPAADPKKDAGGDTAKDGAKDPSKSGDKTTTAKVNKIEKATFGGGCFWCMEAVFERIPGVKSVVSGYSGGSVPNPTYEMVCTGLTGHAEVIQIDYDPAVIGFDKLLHFFWSAHDPTTLNSQGPDFGT